VFRDIETGKRDTRRQSFSQQITAGIQGLVLLSVGTILTNVAFVGYCQYGSVLTNPTLLRYCQYECQ